MPTTRKSKAMPGKFLQGQGQAEGQIPTPRRPFTQHEGVDRAVQNARGMTVGEVPAGRGFFIDLESLEDNLKDLPKGGQGGGDIENIVATAVQAAVRAAIPAIVKAVKDACVESVREKINPHLLRTQFKIDDLDQRSRMDSLRVSGLAEQEGESEDSEEELTEKICKLAGEVGVGLKPEDVASCHRFGKKPGPAAKPRQCMVRFIARRKRDELYQARFKLKGKASYKGVFVNEDLTPLRYAVLMAAKNAPGVKQVTSRNGNISCKMHDDSFKTLRSPDDLFEIGVEDVKYENFRLHII